MASITISPNPSYHSDGISRTRVPRSISSMPAALGRMRTFGRRASARRSSAVVPQPGTAPNRARQPRRDFEKDGDALHRAGIDHGDQPALEVRQVGKRARAVNGRMDHRRCAPQLALDVAAMCRPMATTPADARHQFRGVAVGVPTRRAEGEELRRVRQVDHAPCGRVMRLAQQGVAQVLGRDQHPIRLELADLPAQRLDAPRRVLHRKQHNGFVTAERARLPRRPRTRCGTRARRAASWFSQTRLLRVAPPRGGA